jgi:hypothetical protein
MTTFTALVYVNVGEDNFAGYKPRDPIAEVDTFAVRADDPLTAADGAWVIGNKMSNDADGKSYPLDVRSVSVGDLLMVSDGTRKWFYSVDSFGFTEIPEPTNPIVPLAGTAATSREVQ